MVKIYVMTHKKSPMPQNKIYIPMQVGSAINDDLSYKRDDYGENISKLNPYFSELTGMYWIWKNEEEADIVGLCHYRRFLIDENKKLLTDKKIKEYLDDFDIITTKLLTLNCSYYEGFAADHNQKDMDILSAVIKKYYPEYFEIFESVVNSNRTYFGNMIIARKDIFDDYSRWLFDILFKTMEKVDMTSYNGYEKRLYGFLSEVLLLVYIRFNKLKVKECMVAMMGEKNETMQVKKDLALFFSKKDITGAKNYFLEKLKKRPDILMEASDIYGDLKICMQLISTAEYEYLAGKENMTINDLSSVHEYTGTYLDKYSDIEELITKFKYLNDITEREYFKNARPEDKQYLIDENFSTIAKDISKKVVLAKLDI